MIKILMLGLLASLSAIAASKEITVQVQGMVCAFCSQGITKKFKAQEAIENVAVDMDKKEVRLTLKEGKDLTDSKISELIKDAGVNVEKINR